MKKAVLQMAQEHRAAVIISLIIGLLFLLPHIVMPILQEDGAMYSPLVVLGVDARSVDEVLYASYVQEVAEGHLLPRSNILEWKERLIISHAGAPFPSFLLGVLSVVLRGVVTTYIFSYFFFTAIASMLIYSFTYLLTKNKVIALLAAPLLFFSPTYILKFFTDNITQPVSYFSRFYPVLVDFPIFVITMLLAFFLLKKKEWKFIVLTGILGGMLFYTYFYYWTFYLVFMGLLLGYCLLQKEFSLAKKIALSLAITIAIGATFFLNSWDILSNQTELLQRLGATFGRQPDWGSTVFLVIVLAFIYFLRKKNQTQHQEFDFAAILILSGIVCMNVQMITGYTINPRHWLTTAIWPALVLAAMMVLHYQHFFHPVTIKKWTTAAITLLLLFGLVWQITFAQNMAPAYTIKPTQTELFMWLNSHTAADDVVLSLSSELILLLPVYTHNNNYIPNANVEPIPLSEIVMRRLVALKLLGVSPKNITFVDNPCGFAQLLKADFEDHKQGQYNYSLFEDAFSHHITFESAIAKQGCTLPASLKMNIIETYNVLPVEWDKLIKKYRVHYIVISPYEQRIVQRPLSEISTIVYANQNYTVYQVKP